LNFEEQYQGAIKLAEKQKLPPSEVEAQVFGATHAETGAYLLSVWGLPLPIVEAVARHHAPARTMDKHFTATTALHLAEQLEYSEDHVRRGSKDLSLDTDYPAGLQIGGRMDELKALFRRETAGDLQKPEKDEKAEPSTTTSNELRAEPAALPANGEPAPLLEVVPGDASDRESKKTVFLVIACVSIFAACVLAFISQSHKAKAKAAIAASEIEDAANRKNQLSNMLVETSEQAPQEEANVSTANPLKGLSLQAVMFNGAKSTMVINGRTMRVGDEINGVKIVEVQTNEVIVEKEGQKHTLRME
jgi:hypothetical protein